MMDNRMNNESTHSISFTNEDGMLPVIDFKDFIPPIMMKRKTNEISQRKRRKEGIPTDERKHYKQFPGKFCYYCGTVTTTEWRRGPDRNNSLCNACGLKFTQNRKKEMLISPKQPRRIPIQDLLN
eukprot:TRINITY_DN15585_c0_g1_i1.p1 TRINITY_DN15585_c0_g1~~TRINITY_DN15585_c0_g1_i1.p1  ORF type:complete len:125 (-),score=33.90 TRINITY_DN15585_c0_g1_i1:202-576(-)